MLPTRSRGVVFSICYLEAKLLYENKIVRSVCVCVLFIFDLKAMLLDETTLFGVCAFVAYPLIIMTRCGVFHF